MKIGKIGAFRRERISFKDYIKKYWTEGRKKELIIKRIFLPQKYDSFTLLLEDRENNLEIKRSLQKDLGKRLITEFKLSIKKDNPGILILRLDEDGNQEIFRKDTQNFGYRFEKNYYKLIELKEKTEDIDFPF